jgi:putative transposase
VKSVKEECLRHFVFFGERHLRYVIREHVAYYNHERFHLGIGGKLIGPASANDNTATGAIKCRSRLGGLLNYYDRAAA